MYRARVMRHVATLSQQDDGDDSYHLNSRIHTLLLIIKRYLHPDLDANFNSTVGYNAGRNTYGGAAQFDDLGHGTMIAGLIAGVWHNGITIAGEQ